MNENTPIEPVLNEEVVTPNTPPHESKRLRFALIRALAALLLAAVLFIIFSAPILGLIRGPHELEDINTEASNAFVKRDIPFIIGFYADEENPAIGTAARYGLVPMNGKFVSVRFTTRYLESAGVILENTYDYINGKIDYIDNYVTVQGSVNTLSEDRSAIMYDWFGLNKAQLVEMGMIADTEDYADYLSDYVLIVDTVGGYNQNLVFAIMGLIAALAIYTLIELCMMAGGIYLPKQAAAEASFVDAEPQQDDPAIAPESEGGAQQEEIPAEADGGDLGEAENEIEPEQDDPAAAPESEGGAQQEEIPAEADGEDLGEVAEEETASDADGDAQ